MRISSTSVEVEDSRGLHFQMRAPGQVTMKRWRSFQDMNHRVHTLRAAFVLTSDRGKRLIIAVADEEAAPGDWSSVKVVDFIAPATASSHLLRRRARAAPRG